MRRLPGCFTIDFLVDERSFMRLRCLRILLALPVLALAVTVPSLTGSNGPQASAASKPSVTCKQLTKGQIQPFLIVHIVKVKITAASFGGQQCVFSGPDGDGAIDVLVINGKQYYKEDVRDSHLKVAVPGVGDKAARAKGDFQIDALEGNELCSVSVGSSDSITGVAALQDAANNTSDIPESANAILAKALGTICNRLFKKGNTTPSFAGLSPGTTTSST
jgi:hypothetical protein